MKQRHIEWNKAKLTRFEKAYVQAAHDGLDIFTFEAHDFVLGYAKYLIEYLRTQIK